MEADECDLDKRGQSHIASQAREDGYGDRPRAIGQDDGVLRALLGAARVLDTPGRAQHPVHPAAVVVDVEGVSDDPLELGITHLDGAERPAVAQVSIRPSTASRRSWRRYDRGGM